MTRFQPDRLRLTLLAALGLLPLSCGGETPSNPFPCLNPEAGLDPSGNTEVCQGDLRHRTQARACPSILPRPESQAVFGAISACEFDADCTEKANGYCAVGQFVACAYGCTTDSECGNGQVCDCGPVIGTCVEAHCETSADCSDGFLCSAYDASAGCGVTTFACQTAGDQCGSNEDCTNGTLCRVDVSGFRVCTGLACAIGRPFLVRGEVRLAGVATRSDWSGSAFRHSMREEARDYEARALLAEAWTRIGQMEHASIAAFARFTLELLALSAPADLVLRATKAQSDEIAHAQAAFHLASRFAGRSIGPGPLQVEGCLEAPSLESSVQLAVLEGCVGETLAAIEAAEALEYATDPEVRAVLDRVVREESAHAELAFRFVSWAFGRDPSLRHTITQALDRALRAEGAREMPGAELENPALLAHGVLPEAQRWIARQKALFDVVVPCLTALLEGPSGMNVTSTDDGFTAERS